MRDLHTTFIEVFQYMYRKALVFNDYKFIPTENQNKQIANFIIYLGKQIDINSIGLNWVYDFILWGIREKVENRRTYKGKIPPNWIIGKKAYENFLNKPPEHWAYLNRTFAVKKGIRFEDLAEDMEIECDDYWETVRKENFQKDKPIRYCFETVPYERMSTYCLRCVDKVVCKKMNS